MGLGPVDRQTCAITRSLSCKDGFHIAWSSSRSGMPLKAFYIGDIKTRLALCRPQDVVRHTLSQVGNHFGRLVSSNIYNLRDMMAARQTTHSLIGFDGPAHACATT